MPSHRRPGRSASCQRAEGCRHRSPRPPGGSRHVAGVEPAWNRRWSIQLSSSEAKGTRTPPPHPLIPPQGLGRLGERLRPGQGTPFPPRAFQSVSRSLAKPRRPSSQIHTRLSSGFLARHDPPHPSAVVLQRDIAPARAPIADALGLLEEPNALLEPELLRVKAPTGHTSVTQPE
jgi:hypothetical protein